MDYAASAKKAAAMIEKSGVAMILRVVTEGAYVPGSGTPAQTTIDYPVFGVLTNYKSGQVDGTLVQVGDMQVIVGGPLSPRPEAGNLLHISGELWGIVAVQRVAPDGTDIIYKVQIRKG